MLSGDSSCTGVTVHVSVVLFLEWQRHGQEVSLWLPAVAHKHFSVYGRKQNLLQVSALHNFAVEPHVKHPARLPRTVWG